MAKDDLRRRPLYIGTQPRPTSAKAPYRARGARRCGHNLRPALRRRSDASVSSAVRRRTFVGDRPSPASMRLRRALVAESKAASLTPQCAICALDARHLPAPARLRHPGWRIQGTQVLGDAVIPKPAMR